VKDSAGQQLAYVYFEDEVAGAIATYGQQCGGATERSLSAFGGKADINGR
jgi:hypothetical protein